MSYKQNELYTYWHNIVFFTPSDLRATPPKFYSKIQGESSLCY